MNPTALPVRDMGGEIHKMKHNAMKVMLAHIALLAIDSAIWLLIKGTTWRELREESKDGNIQAQD